MFPGGDKQPFVLVSEGTKKGTSEAREGDSINISYPNNMKKRGRVGKGISATVTASEFRPKIAERKMFYP